MLLSEIYFVITIITNFTWLFILFSKNSRRIHNPCLVAELQFHLKLHCQISRGLTDIGNIQFNHAAKIVIWNWCALRPSQSEWQSGWQRQFSPKEWIEWITNVCSGLHIKVIILDRSSIGRAVCICDFVHVFCDHISPQLYLFTLWGHFSVPNKDNLNFIKNKLWMGSKKAK